MSWLMEVSRGEKWLTVNGGATATPYAYETAEEAARMLRMCYPDQVRADRLDKVSTRTRVRNAETGEVLDAWRT